MSKKITKEEFISRFKKVHPDAEFEVVEYTAISNKCTIKCLKCGREYTKTRARDFLNRSFCREEDFDRFKVALRRLEETNGEYVFIKKHNNFLTIRHTKCGLEQQRAVQAVLDNPCSCEYCNTISTSQMLPIEEVQKRLDEQFNGEIKILEYSGQLEKNKYKCLKCGLIFTQQHTCLTQSRGCPKCDKNKSNGEKYIAKLLEQKGIKFEEQVGVADLPLQHFDFGIYDENDSLLYFIEVQGEQHREEREIFRDSLAKIQERDERKRKYCKENNIPLYELIYQKGKFKNLDILPF
jgi:predicted  nucleic acid-binding Zn-ribbon protein